MLNARTQRMVAIERMVKSRNRRSPIRLKHTIAIGIFKTTRAAPPPRMCASVFQAIANVGLGIHETLCRTIAGCGARNLTQSIQAAKLANEGAQASTTFFLLLFRIINA